MSSYIILIYVLISQLELILTQTQSISVPMEYIEPKQYFHVSSSRIQNVPLDNTANFTIPSAIRSRTQPYHEPFILVNQISNFQIPNQNDFYFYIKVATLTTSSFQIKLTYINQTITGYGFSDYIVHGINPFSYVSVTYMIISSFFPDIWVCKPFQLASYSIPITIDSSTGYDQVFNLTNQVLPNITYLKLNSSQTVFISSFQHLTLSSHTLNQNKFSVSATISVLSPQSFNVHLTSKYTVDSYDLKLKIFIYNKNQFLMQGYKIFTSTVSFNNLIVNQQNSTYLANYKPTTLQLLYGLNTFDVINQNLFGFKCNLTTFTNDINYFLFLDTTQSGHQIVNIQFQIIQIAQISCPSGYRFVNQNISQCYNGSCPSGMLKTSQTASAGNITLVICKQCVSPCVECYMVPSYCTLCTTGFYASSGSCTLCSSMYPNCLQCTNSECTKCSDTYFVDKSLTCQRCSILTKYCLDCENTNPGTICTSCSIGFTPSEDKQYCFDCDLVTSRCLECSNTKTCTVCKYPYIIGSTGLCDQCASGYYHIDQFCIKIPGCQNVFDDLTNSKQKCIACLAQYHFVYVQSNATCACDIGYTYTSVNSKYVCVSKCGDGITSLSDEQCDDSNLIDNDGCDHTCKIEDNFECTQDSPSQCTLNFQFTKFEYNYATRIEGKNRCKFSFSLYPDHSVLRYVDWSKFLKVNLSSWYIVSSSAVYSYIPQTSEIFMEFDYLQNLEDIVIQAKLSFSNNNITRRLLYSDEQNNIIQIQSLYQNDFKLVSQSQSLSLSPKLVSNPSQLSLNIQLSGSNSPLIFQSPLALQTYQVTSIISIIITILIMIQFIIGSYFHKMIGLETIQVLQFFFFVRMIIDQKNSSLLNSMNVLKYSAYGGYANYPIIYNTGTQQAESLTYMTVSKNFVYVGLMKFFSCNVNFSLIPAGLFLAAFIFVMIRKFKKRNEYINTRQQSQKDLYTVLRRSSQWFYDHFTFPYIIIFNMIIVFCTILYLQSLSTSSSTNLKNSSGTVLFEVTSFIPHLIVVFLTFFLYCFEIFLSYEEFIHSQLTPSEKERVPESMIQKLQHDENNPDRPNYKPGYVLFYLINFLVIQIVIMLTVMIKTFKQFGVEIIIGINVLYLVYVWLWKPYCLSVNFHNKTLRLNHVTIVIFMLVCEIFHRASVDVILYVLLIYILMVLLIAVTVCGYIRIYIQYKFRKALLDDPDILTFDQKQLKKHKQLKDKNNNQLTKKQALLIKNQFLFENQIKDIVQKDKVLSFQNKTGILKNSVQQAKNQIRKKIYGDKQLKKIIETSNYFDELHYGVNLLDMTEHNNKGFMDKHDELKTSKYFKLSQRNIQRQDMSKQIRFINDEQIEIKYLQHQYKTKPYEKLVSKKISPKIYK